MSDQLCKIVVYVPAEVADDVRKALAESGCGKIGNYDSCSFSVKGVGRFRPLDGANPVIGKIGKPEEVEEERIESICRREDVEKVRAAVKAAHPYEEPVVDFYELMG